MTPMASAYTLEFEKPLLELERQIEDLKRIGIERQIDIDGELEGLQTKLEGPNFEVVAINIDTRDPEKPKNFLKEANLTRLGFFSDEKAKVFQDLKRVGRALGMPTSVLVDGQGCEIATIAGPAEWDSDDAIKLIKAAVGPAAAGF